MAMNSFRIVESFQIFENQAVCLLVIVNFKAVEPFTFDNRMEGFNAGNPMEMLSLSNYAAYFLLLFYIPSQRTDCHDQSE